MGTFSHLKKSYSPEKHQFWNEHKPRIRRLLEEFNEQLMGNKWYFDGNDSDTYLSLRNKPWIGPRWMEDHTEQVTIGVAMGARKLTVTGNQGVWNGMHWTKMLEVYPSDLVDALAEIYKWFLTYPKPDSDISPPLF